MIENTGLILEGGGMRGLYTAGVLDFFMDKDIWFKTTIGVSAGACHGTSYVCRQKGRAKHVSIDYVDNKEYASFSSLIKTGDFFGEKFVYHKIPEELYLIDNETYLRGEMKLYSTLTDCKTGKAQYFKVNDMIKDVDLIRASASLPLLSRFVNINGRDYLDGGVADSVPIEAMENMGKIKNVVILTQPRSYRKVVNKAMPLIKLKYRKYPEFVKAMQIRHEKYNAQLEYIKKREVEGDVFVIAPKEPLNVGRIEKDKNKLLEAYDTGYKDAKAMYSKLLEFLNEK